MAKKYMIQFDSVDEVPTVYVDGRKVKHLVHVLFDWNTNTSWKAPKEFRLERYIGLEPVETMDIRKGEDGWKPLRPR